MNVFVSNAFYASAVSSKCSVKQCSSLDIILRPGPVLPLVSHSEQTPSLLACVAFARSIMGKHDVVHKTGSTTVQRRGRGGPRQG